MNLDTMTIKKLCTTMYKKHGAFVPNRIADENKLLYVNENLIFKQISKQRNYITHNIYALFSDLIDETIMEKEKLLDSDVHLYTERAWQLRDNLNGLSDVIKTKRKK
jgi:hypothetical protein